MIYALNLIEEIDKKQASRNASTSAVVGGIFGLVSTVGVIATFTMVSTNQYINFYVGGFFMVIGVMLLYRVYKRRGLIDTDLGQDDMKIDLG